MSKHNNRQTSTGLSALHENGVRDNHRAHSFGGASIHSVIKPSAQISGAGDIGVGIVIERNTFERGCNADIIRWFSAWSIALKHIAFSTLQISCNAVDKLNAAHAGFRSGCILNSCTVADHERTHTLSDKRLIKRIPRVALPRLKRMR